MQWYPLILNNNIWHILNLPLFFNSHSAVKYLRETENHWCCVNFCEGEMFFFDKKCNFFETKHHLHMEYFADRIWSSLNNFWHFEVFVCFRVYWCKCFSQRFKFTTDLLGDVLNRCLFAYVFVLRYLIISDLTKYIFCRFILWMKSK